MSNSAVKTKKNIKISKSKVEYIRLPLDNITQQVIASIKVENPYFNDLDAIRFWLGKRLVSPSIPKPRTMSQFFDNYPRANVNINESDMYQIANKTLGRL